MDPDGEDEQEGISPKSKDEVVQLDFQAGWDGLMARYKRMLTEEILILLQATFRTSCRTGFWDMLGGSVNWGLLYWRVTLQVSLMS